MRQNIGGTSRLGGLVARARKNAGLSTEALAERMTEAAGERITRGTITYLERTGKASKVGPATFRGLAAALDIDPIELMSAAGYLPDGFDPRAPDQLRMQERLRVAQAEATALQLKIREQAVRIRELEAEVATAFEKVLVYEELIREMGRFMKTQHAIIEALRDPGRGLSAEMKEWIDSRVYETLALGFARGADEDAGPGADEASAIRSKNEGPDVLTHVEAGRQAQQPPESNPETIDLAAQPYDAGGRASKEGDRDERHPDAQADRPPDGVST